MKTTWRKLQIFAAIADAYLNESKGETKISYAIKRVRDQIAKHSDDVQILLNDIDWDLCEADDKGRVERDASGNLQFTRATGKQRFRQQQAILDQEFEIEPYYLQETPPAYQFSPVQLAAFDGLILPLSEGADQAGEASAPPVTQLQEETASVAS